MFLTFLILALLVVAFLSCLSKHIEDDKHLQPSVPAETETQQQLITIDFTRFTVRSILYVWNEIQWIKSHLELSKCGDCFVLSPTVVITATLSASFYSWLVSFITRCFYLFYWMNFINVNRTKYDFWYDFSPSIWLSAYQ